MMKKILNSFLILFAICLSLTLGNAFFDVANAEEATPTPSVVLLAKNKDDSKGIKSFAEYVNAFGASNVSDNIVLVEDIDLNGAELTGTIGTVENPFSGTFDGKGFHIKNAVVDARNDMTQENATIEETQVASIFGSVYGATIQNLSISGTITMKSGGCSTLVAGGVVALAERSKFQNIQVGASIDLQTNLAHNLVFGGVAGRAIDSEFKNIISRPTNLNNFTFENPNGKFYTVGGVVGDLDNSQIIFSVSKANLKASVTAEFEGTLYLGGIAGKVSQGGSKLINIASENTYNITNNSVASQSNVKYGQIVGLVANPAPASNSSSRLMSMSYIHYINAQNIPLFGDIGQYAFLDDTVKDYITPATENLTSRAYFNNQPWHDMYGAWDFESTWYIGSGTINLQSFYGSGVFNVSVSGSSNKIASENDKTDATILTYTAGTQTNYRYGDKAEITFTFVEGMRAFYNVTALLLNGNEVAKIDRNSDDSYRISGSTKYSIQTKVESQPGGGATNQTYDPNTFTIIIKHVNLATAGAYSLNIPEQTFTINVTSRCYDEEGQIIDGNKPAYVFYSASSATEASRLELQDKTIKYGKFYSFGTTEKNNDPIAFCGWYLVKKDGDGNETSLKKLSANKTISFNFGKDELGLADTSGIGENNDTKIKIESSCDIVAVYIQNACAVTFNMTGEGVAKIELFSGEIVVDENGQSVNVSKTRDRVKLDLYIKDGHNFDVETFLEELSTYKGGVNDEIQFCEDSGYRSQIAGMTQYTFYLNMNALNTTDFENGFTIKIKTSQEEKQEFPWLWVGIGAGGGVLLIVLIIVIIVVVKRRGGSGGGRFNAKSFNKKNIKGMYF